MKVGEEQLRAVQLIWRNLDEYDHVKQGNRSVGLDDNFRKFREQLWRVQFQLREHLEG